MAKFYIDKNGENLDYTIQGDLSDLVSAIVAIALKDETFKNMLHQATGQIAFITELNERIDSKLIFEEAKEMIFREEDTKRK